MLRNTPHPRCSLLCCAVGFLLRCAPGLHRLTFKPNEASMTLSIESTVTLSDGVKMPRECVA